MLLLANGEKFPANEATTLFFSISKLFQNKDPSLRQMMYLILKELSKTAEDTITERAPASIPAVKPGSRAAA